MPISCAFRSAFRTVMAWAFILRLCEGASTSPSGARLLSILIVPPLSARKPNEEIALVLKVDDADGLLK